MCARVLVFMCNIVCKNTPVLMANNPFKNVAPAMALATMPLIAPIKDVKVDDMVKAYHHEEMFLTASNNDDVYVPGWQDYDYLDITPETWQVGKFIIEEEDGNHIEVEVNRPKEWFKTREVRKVGDEAFLYMPDVNIIGNAKLIEFNPTEIDTRVLSLNENGQVDRPVISTFKRFSPIVFDYSFSDGSKIGATPEHPFYSVDRQDYIPVGELQEGELVKSSSDKEVRFIGSKLRNKGESVYNFEVWREHNYFVSGNKGEDFILVHNTYGKWLAGKAEFTNPAGTLVKFNKQSNWTETAIKSKRDLATGSKRLEYDAALKLKQSGLEVKGIGLIGNNGNIGDLDVWTNKGMVEVKTSINKVKVDQIRKYMDPTDPKFMNPSKAIDVNAKKVLVYVENATEAQMAAKKAQILEELGDFKNVFDFDITNSLDDLANLMNN